MQIRKGEFRDIPEVLKMVREFHREGVAEHGLGYDERSARETAFGIYYAGVSLVLEDDKEGLCGVLGGFLIPFCLNYQAKVFQEVLFYIKPEHRKGTWALRLIKEMERYCGEVGCTHVLMAHLHGNNVNLSRVYERLGYRVMESQYLKGIQ
jgi:GNAT superfamily N-acetyltransferase